VLSSFFYGYFITQYPGGRLAELYGGKWVFGIGILVTSVFTLLTPIAAHTNFGLLIAVRVIEGAAYLS
jgi:ACS family sodium-dependent inorganic phosphate cotransporter-like MFS transporter 5